MAISWRTTLGVAATCMSHARLKVYHDLSYRGTCLCRGNSRNHRGISGLFWLRILPTLNHILVARSVDLAWDQLQQSLADTLAEALNRTLASTARPSFIGPAEVTSFEFGSNAPEIEVVDVRDIHPDFLEDDSEDEGGGSQGEEGAGYEDEEEEYEWVPRRQAAREPLSPPRTPARNQSFGARDFFGGAGIGGIGIHGLPRTLGSGGMALAGVGGVGIGVSPLGRGRRSPYEEEQEEEVEEEPLAPNDDEDEPGPNAAPAPALQMHLHILFHSNLRLVVKTSVLLNYPSESFLSLPVKLCVTGLEFDGELVVAYEGPKRRVHLCIVDDLDPYGLASDRRNRTVNMSTDSLPVPGPDNGSAGTPEHLQPSPSPVDRSLPIGQRLLPSILIETEIGQADKHVLRNVSRVERFLQDVMRKTLEDELVFPNFHTIILG